MLLHKTSLVLLCVCSLSSVEVIADKFNELDEEINEYQRQKDIEQTDFDKFVSKETKIYEQWRTEYLKEFDQFQLSVVQKWGAVEMQNKQRFVEFNESKDSKVIVDLDKSEIEVSIIVNKATTEEEAQKQLQLFLNKQFNTQNSVIAELFNEQAKLLVEKREISMEEIAFNNENKQQLKIAIVEQMQAEAQEIDKQADRAQLDQSDIDLTQAVLLANDDKKQLIEDSKQRLVDAEKGYEASAKNAESLTNNKKVISYTVQLPENSIKLRAEKYVGFAEKESLIYGVSAPLIMAVMHSESAFDPNARSPIPAYGLMQIVPHSAGHDVNKLYRNIDQPMTKEALYQPATNVETGTAYLAILDQRYLRKIINPQSRLYLTIAAYNTGAGNVARAFNSDDSRNINDAAVIINTLTPAQVYDRLIKNLPYDETKHYLERVNGRIALYNKS